MLPLLLGDEAEQDPDDNGQIKVYLDNTDYIKAYYAQITIRKAFKKSAEIEMMRCGLQKDIVNIPMTFERFDDRIYDFKPTMVTAFALR